MLRVLLLIVVSVVMMSTVGAYEATAETTGDLTVDSASTEPLEIGWRLTTGLIDGVAVSWTPVNSAVYTIQVTTGGITSTMQVGPTATARRTDIVPIIPLDAPSNSAVNISCC